MTRLRKDGGLTLRWWSWRGSGRFEEKRGMAAGSVGGAGELVGEGRESKAPGRDLAAGGAVIRAAGHTTYHCRWRPSSPG